MVNSLEVLKNILGDHGAIPESNEPVSLDNLTKFIDQKDDTNILLELVRAEATNNDDELPEKLNSLSAEEIFFLTGKLEEHQSELKTYKDKLKPIGYVLNKFNQELNELSSSLVSLHEQSNKLSSNLESQTTSMEKLNPIILDLMISPEIAESVLSGKIDVDWLENIKFINEKLQLIKNVNEGTIDEKLRVVYKDSVAFSQLKEGIDLLVVKAVERIRDFIITNIKHLRSSTSKSSQAIQQELLRVKDTFTFLKIHQPKLADQLQLAYFYTMKWYYKSRFAKYLYALQKLHLRHVDSSMVLGGDNIGASTAEDRINYISGGIKSWIYSGSSSANAPSVNPHTKVTFSEYLLSIDKRLDVLSNDRGINHKTAIPAQIAESTPFGYWIEFVFNQWHTALLDNVIVEYLFVIEFFFDGEEKHHIIEFINPVSGESETKDWSLLVFENVYLIGKDFVNWLITHMPSIFLAANRASTTLNSSRVTSALTHSFQGSCDSYAMLLMIRIIQTSQVQLHNEFHIPVLEDHLNLLLLLLWPQFTKIIDLNCEAMKKSIFRINHNSHNLAPAQVTQQFGQFLLGLLKLSAIDIDGAQEIETLRGEPLYSSITRLRSDFENVLTKLSNQIKNSSDREIFLYNNYFLIVSILTNENKENANEFIDEQISHFDMLCQAYKAS